MTQDELNAMELSRLAELNAPNASDPNAQMMNLADKATCQMVRNRILEDNFKSLKGKFKIEHYRNGKLLDTYNINNDITNEGKNTILEIMFHDGTQIASSSWFIGLISNSGFSALAAADTMASHSGWTEFTGYSQATRVAWGPGAAASQSITNSTPATFDINATGTVKGIFVTSNSTKSGTTGKLWATALFTADVPVVNGDQLKVTYTVSA
jgi:hypothetical protein